MILQARGISKQFLTPCPVTILRDISLTISAGDTVAIVGKSGEGKTTLLHILGTLDEPSSGTLEICGEVVENKNASHHRQHQIGFIFQAYHLLEEFSVLDNILLPARIRKEKVGPGSPAKARALHLLETVGLAHRADFPAKLLSGGEKQRVAIARALINDPQLILADEPSGNLDHATSGAIYDLLLSLAREKKKGLVIVTHDREFANRCQTVYTLQDGQLA